MIPVEKPEPFTVVERGILNWDEIAQRLDVTRREHGDVLQRYHEISYNSGHTWTATYFLGLSILKCPNDLWAYQDIITMLRPATIIETGTLSGASALWFAVILDALGIPNAHIYTIDINDYRACGDHPRITFLGGDWRDPMMRDAIQDDRAHRGIADGPLLITLDSDHSTAHVLAELELWAPLCRVGDRLVVEDTNIAWGPGQAGPILPIGDRGARGAVTDYLTAHPGEWKQDFLHERHLLTMHPGGWLIRVAEATDVMSRPEES